MGEFQFTVVDTSGLEPSGATNIQVLFCSSKKSIVKCLVIGQSDKNYTELDETRGFGSVYDRCQVKPFRTRRKDATCPFVVFRVPLTFADDDVAKWMHKLIPDTSKVMLVANKCETLATQSGKSMEGLSEFCSKRFKRSFPLEIRENLFDAYRLGMGEPVSISAETGDGMINLCESLIPFIEKHKNQGGDASNSLSDGSLCQ